MRLNRANGEAIVCPACQGPDFIATFAGETDDEQNQFRADCLNQECKNRFEFAVGKSEQVQGNISADEQAAFAEMNSARRIPMEDVSLWTRDGGLVVNIEIPTLRPRAEVIVWGERFFVLNKYGKYAEGLAYFVPPAVEPEDEWPDGPIFDEEKDETTANQM